MATDDIDTATDTPSTWPPPIYAQSHGEPENTSGTNTTVPYVVARMTWCWGGFVFPLFWSFANRCPVLGAVAIVIGWLEVYYFTRSLPDDFVRGPGERESPLAAVEHKLTVNIFQHVKSFSLSLGPRTKSR